MSAPGSPLTPERGLASPPGRHGKDIQLLSSSAHQIHSTTLHCASVDKGGSDAGDEVIPGTTTKRKIHQKNTKRTPAPERISSTSVQSNRKSNPSKTKLPTNLSTHEKSETQQSIVNVRKLPSDVSENKNIQKTKEKRKVHQKKAHRLGKQYESFRSNVTDPDAVEQTQHKTTPSALNPTIHSYSSTAGRGTGSRAKTKSHKRVMRAPAPPGSDDGLILDSPRDSSNDFNTLLPQEQEESSLIPPSRAATDNFGFPVPAGWSGPPLRSPPNAKTSQGSSPLIRQSLAKAVVAAAVSEATVNGRAFSHKDVRSKDAMTQLSSDPVCSRHLQAVGQSFKAKPPRVENGSTQDEEIKYKVRLLENLFEDASGQAAPKQRRPVDPPDTPSGKLDTGDAKVPSRRQKDPAFLPPRDIDEDGPLIGSDAEKEGGWDDDTDETQHLSSSHRISLSSRSAGLHGMDEGKATKQIQRWFLLAIALIVGLVITIVVSQVGNGSSPSPTSKATMAPTFHHNSLPDYTKEALLQDSPQNKAYFWLSQDPKIASLSTERGIQRFALATLFYATHGDRWKRSVSWMVYHDECRWYTHVFHTVCNVANQYHTLSLPDNALDGTLPEEMELLSSLNIVQLQDNQLKGKLPHRIWSSWDQLVFLNLYNNSFTGTLPPDVGHLEEASNLNTINLRKNQFMGRLPSEFGLLPLEFLSLSDNWFSGPLPSELGLLSNAAALYLYDNHFSGTIPATLGQLSKLTSLELHNNDLSGTVPVELCNLLSTSSGRLTSLSVDCEKVQCTCGCDCTKGLSLVQDSFSDAGHGNQ